jgi:hypothetical protein
LYAGTTEKLMGVIVDMTDRVAISDCPGIDCPVVAGRVPTIVFFGYDLQGRRPVTFRVASCAVSQHGIKLGFGDS